MIVNISPELRVVAENALCFELQRKAKASKRSKNPDADTWKPLGYYPNLEQACVAALGKGIALTTEEADVKEIVGAIRTAAQVIAAACVGVRVAPTRQVQEN